MSDSEVRKEIVEDSTAKWPQLWAYLASLFLTAEIILKVSAEALRPSFPIISYPPYFALGATHYRNPNSCLGVLRGFSPLLKIVITGLATSMLCAVAAYLYFVKTSVNVRRALVCLLAGSLGNLVDRVTLGVVVDYVDIQIGRDGEILYLAWNFSDILINIGILLMGWSALLKEPPFHDEKQKKTQ